MKEIPFLVIEHNIEFIKSADYVVELGPEGGDAGGRLLFAGTPSEMKMSEKLCYGRIFMMIPDCSISIATQSPVFIIMKDLQKQKYLPKTIEENGDERYETNDCIRYSRIRILLSGNAGCDEKTNVRTDCYFWATSCIMDQEMIFRWNTNPKGNQNVK